MRAGGHRRTVTGDSCQDGHLEHPPQLERVGDEDVWHLTWDTGTGQPPWQLVIDPASEEPLRTR